MTNIGDIKSNDPDFSSSMGVKKEIQTQRYEKLSFPSLIANVISQTDSSTDH